MLTSMRQHASQQQSVGRDSLLAQKRGLKSPVAQTQVRKAFSSTPSNCMTALQMQRLPVSQYQSADDGHMSFALHAQPVQQTSADDQHVAHVNDKEML